MALSISCKGSFSADGKQMFGADTTGIYNVVSNPTGFGTPNPASTTVTTFQFICNWISAGSVITYNFTAVSGTITVATCTDNVGTTVNILSSLTSTAFPIVDPNFLDLTNNFSNGIVLPTLADGQFQLTYKIVGINSGVAYNQTTSTTYFRAVDLCCCLANLRLKATADCDCSADVMAQVNEADFWLKSALCAVDTGKPNDTALEYFTKAQTVCSDDCGCNG